MVLKPLPDKLVSRLKGIIEERGGKRGEDELIRMMGRMRIADHRYHIRDRDIELNGRLFKALARSDTSDWGRRVRELNVSRNFPRAPIVLKISHSRFPNVLIRQIKAKVINHNENFRNSSYILREPHAYLLWDRVIAMSKTDRPSLVEIMGRKRQITTRGLRFLRKMQRQHGFSRRKLLDAASKLWERTGIDPGNFLFVGVNRGKFVFVPLIDVY